MYIKFYKKCGIKAKRRFRDFCPHREPRCEFIAQYIPPMSFRYISWFHNAIEFASLL